MPACPSCHSANPAGNAFCGQCGAPLAVTSCPTCGARNTEAQRYCGQCGGALAGGALAGGALAGGALAGGALAGAPTSEAPLDERKLATVVFADVVGFTSLAERTDPEVVARMVDAAFRELSQAVTAHGGTVDKFMGDSVMAVFGVPVAHDDDAERAVAAALAMRDLGGDLAFSIGVNSGEVMATTVGRAGDMTVIGDTVNVAARLEKAAGPGEVLCGRMTVELARHRVRFRERQSVLLKGKREPVGVWVAESLRAAGGDWAAEGPRLVGRDDELAFLAAQWRGTVKERQPRVLLLSGEAGSGKSRLQAELALVAEGEATVVRGTYPSYGLLGGTRLAKEVTGQLGPSRDDSVNARIRSVAGEIDPSLTSIDPTGMQQEQLWALVQLLQEKAEERPLLLAIDDMHRSDERTLELMSEMAKRLSDVPVLMVLAGRSEPSDWLTRFTESTSVRLAPLRRPDAVALAAEFVPELVLAEEAAEFLAERAGGNPLYLRELVAMAQARGLFVESGGSYRLAAYGAIPATLHAVLASRLDALDPRQKLVLQHVAVLGDSATAQQVAQLGAPDAQQALRSLVEAGLLRRGSDGCYEAPDPLLREVAYETLPHNLRGELHRTAAATAATDDGRARHLDRATEYLTHDEELAIEAAEALADEGERLSRASQHRDAVRVLERAVALGCRRPTALFALAVAQGQGGRRGEALATLALVPDDPGDAAVAIKRDHIAANTQAFDDPAWAAPRLEAVAERWRQIGNISQQAWAWSNAGVSYFNLSRMNDSVTALEQALELFDQLGDEEGTLATTSFLCIAKPTDSRVPAWLDRALEFADAAGDRGKQASTLTTLAWNHFFRSFCGAKGDVEDAEGFAGRLADVGEELGALDIAVHGWSLLVVMARWSGRIGTAGVRASELQRLLGAAQGGELWLGWAASYSAAVAAGASEATPPFPPEALLDPIVAVATTIIEVELVLAGRAMEALAHLERAERPHRGVVSDLPGVMHALALIVTGRPGEAEPYLDRAEDAGRRLESRAVLAAAQALRAEVRQDPSLLPPLPAQPIGVADLIVLRAHGACGDEAARNALSAGAQAISAPGLLIFAAGARPSPEHGF